MRLDLLPHIVVAVRHRQLKGAGSILIVEIRRQPGEKRLALPKFLPVVIPDNHMHPHLGFVAGHIRHMVKALAPLGMRRCFRRWQQRNPLRRIQYGIAHLILGGAGVGIHPVDHQIGSSGIEVFIFKLIHLAAVHRIGVIRVKAGEIKMIRPAADLLIGGEAYGNAPVAPLRMRRQFGAGGDDLRHPRLIVRTQQRGAVADDHLLAEEFILQHLRIGTVIGDDAGLDILTAHIRRGIHMGNQPDLRCFLAAGGGR